MARTMKKGDTWPPLRGEASDESGSPVDLSAVVSLEVIMTSPTHTITGSAVAIHPPLADEDGVHNWNWQYNWQAGDTDNAGEYAVELKVTWALGPPVELETFPNTGSETLVIEAT